MKKILFILSTFIFTIGATAQKPLTPTDAGSTVNFTIKNFGLNTGGTFKGLKGSIIYNPANVAATVINVSLDANSVNTDNNKRDEHLRKEEYFNVAKYPELTFKSTKITTATTGIYLLDGIITIKGVSKPVSFLFKISASNGGYLFQGSFDLNRRDFGVGGNSAVLGDKLKVILSVFAK